MPETQKEQRELFQKTFSVSHETMAKLDRYGEMLTEWNAKFNLIAESTLPIIWQRHFLDSAQLIKYFPNNVQTVTDLGSGAGFPGIILSIIGSFKVSLIESIGKKANFLRAVIGELDLNADVHSVRIESMHGVKFDIVTARALKPLPLLLKLAMPLIKKDSVAVFLKGQKLDAELTESSKYWKFDHEIFQSLSDPSGRVLKISNLRSSSGNRKR